MAAGRREARELEELYFDVRGVLVRSGFRISPVRYPEKHDSRSIDLLAVGSERRLFIKVTVDVASIDASDVRELRRVSRCLEARPLVVARRERGEPLEDIVAYERQGVYTVTPAGLEAALSDGIYVVRRRGTYYMRVDGEALRRYREEHGLSLGDLAARIGTSRRAVYEYERCAMDVSLPTAMKIMELVGEEAFQPIRILDEEPPREKPRLSGFDVEEERSLAEEAARASAEVAHAKKAPMDLAVRRSSAKAVVLVEHRRESRQRIVFRGSEAARIANEVNAVMIAVARSREVAADLEGLGFEAYTSIEEARSALARHLKGSGVGDTID